MFCRSSLLLLIVALSAVACDRTRGPDGEGMAPCDELALPAIPRDASVVVIVNDTMRRDHMGAYGGRARTPAFDAFAKDNFLFEHAYTQAVWTKPSVATLFTSLYPSQHRVETDPQIRNPTNTQRGGELLQTDILSSKLTTLAEVMKANGYDTAGFIANPWLEKRFGFDQGFDVYDDSFAQWGARGEVVSQAALKWLQQQPPGHKFFLYLHYLDSHLPYGVLDRAEVERRKQELAADKRPLNDQAMMAVKVVSRFADGGSPLTIGFRPALGFVEMAYDSGLAAFDRSLALFLAGFATHWSADNAVVIATSDHGEALYERGYGNHGTGLFDDEVAIPLAARFPAVHGVSHQISCPVGLVDVMPTLCTYLGLRCPNEMFGTSVITPPSGTDGARSRRYLVTEGVARRPEHRAIRNREYKLLWETGPRGDGKTKADPYSLYDVSVDPREQRDLRRPENRSPENERVFQTLSAALKTAVPHIAAPDAEQAPVDPALRERLRQLGYTE
jgi:arylsulfatase